jgi:hypothetical protein
VRRTVLGLAAAGIAAAAVVTATSPAPVSTVALVPSAAATCVAAGPYRVPEPGSTGVPAGLALCSSAAVTVTRAGTVLDGWDITGGVVVAAPGVTIRRSRITGDGSSAYGVVTSATGTVRIEDTTLTGDFSGAALGGDRWSAERVTITRVTRDGAHLGEHARLRNSRVTDLTPPAGVSAAALVLDARGRDVLVEDTVVEAGGRAASAVRATAGQGVVRGSTLGGGRWTVEIGPDADLQVRDSRFRRDAVAGPLRVPPGTALAGNAFVDGGRLPQP